MNEEHANAPDRFVTDMNALKTTKLRAKKPALAGKAS
jgi:hypothetical protein